MHGYVATSKTFHHGYVFKLLSVTGQEKKDTTIETILLKSAVHFVGTRRTKQAQTDSIEILDELVSTPILLHYHD